jgi:hypothetical protein
MCNISIYFYNIHMKYLQRTFKTSEIFKRYICNMWRILIRPPSPPAAGSHSRSRSVRPEGFHTRARAHVRWPRCLAGGRGSYPQAWARWCPRRQVERAAEQEQQQGRSYGRGSLSGGGGSDRVLGKKKKETPWTMDKSREEVSFSYPYPADAR